MYEMTYTSKYILTLVFLFTLTGCTSQEDEYLFRYANAQPGQHPRSLSMNYFEQLIEESSAGRIKVENYYSSSLGTERELMDMVSLNILQGTRGGFFTDLTPLYTLYTLPFLVENWDQALNLVNSPFTERVNAEGRKKGFHVPACGISQGFRSHTNSIHPIRTPEDLRGLKMRVAPQETYVITAQVLGASPQEIPFSEVYQAARTGVIDGQDNAPSNIMESRVYEVQKYFSISNYSTGPDPFMVNLEWYKSLPASLQVEFDKAARKAIAYSDEMNRSSELEYIQKLSNVLETNTITGVELERFRIAVQPVYEILIEKGYFTWEDVAAARQTARGN